MDLCTTAARIATAAAVLFASHSAAAAPGIDSARKHSWSENAGWMNWRDGGATGVAVGRDFLAGVIWAENSGWINVGDGAGPYSNSSGLDFGVNIQIDGSLKGFAWGENAGWINFGTTPALGASGARYDAAAQRFRGYAWGENIGWINLDDAVHFVGVDLCPWDLNGDGVVGASDLALLLGDWGAAGALGPADFDTSGAVDAGDLAQMLGAWGACR